MGYAGRPVRLKHFLVALLLTFLGLIGVMGSGLRGGLLLGSLPFYLFVFALLFWMEAIFKRVDVTETGILVKKMLPMASDLFYSFDNIERIRFRGLLLLIKKKEARTSYWLLIPKKSFVEEMRRYAPQKLA